MKMERFRGVFWSCFFSKWRRQKYMKVTFTFLNVYYMILFTQYGSFNYSAYKIINYIKKLIIYIYSGTY